MDTTTHAQRTPAFFAQADASFGTSLTAVAAGIVYLPVGAWIRAFLAIGVFCGVTSAFPLAPCIRDRQESSSVVKRADQARLDELLADHDAFQAHGVSSPSVRGSGPS